MNKTHRPVNLDLSTIQFPATAIASILHRVSGVILFVGIGILLVLLHYSLTSDDSFHAIQELLQTFIGKFVIWGIVTAFIYHAIAGIRHLVMDFGFWEELEPGTRSAQVSFILTLILSIAAGVWLWL